MGRTTGRRPKQAPTHPGVDGLLRALEGIADRDGEDLSDPDGEPAFDSSFLRDALDESRRIARRALATYRGVQTRQANRLTARDP